MHSFRRQPQIPKLKRVSPNAATMSRNLDVNRDEMDGDGKKEPSSVLSSLSPSPSSSSHRANLFRNIKSVKSLFRKKTKGSSFRTNASRTIESSVSWRGEPPQRGGERARKASAEDRDRLLVPHEAQVPSTHANSTRVSASSDPGPPRPRRPSMSNRFMADFKSARSLVQASNQVRSNDKMVTKVHLRGHGRAMNDLDAKELGMSMRSNTYVTLIDLGDCDLTCAGAGSLFRALGRNPSSLVTTILLDGNRIGKAGARAAAEMMLASRENGGARLTHLDLWGNRIGPEGARVIAEALRSPEAALETLEVGCNGIGDGGGEEIAVALRSNATLARLGMGGNGIGCGPAATLADTLRCVNRTLCHLDLRSDPVGEGAVQAQGDNLVELSLDGDLLPPALAEEISGSLRRNCVLIEERVAEKIATARRNRLERRSQLLEGEGSVRADAMSESRPLAPVMKFDESNPTQPSSKAAPVMQQGEGRTILETKALTTMTTVEPGDNGCRVQSGILSLVQRCDTMDPFRLPLGLFIAFVIGAIAISRHDQSCILAEF